MTRSLRPLLVLTVVVVNGLCGDRNGRQAFDLKAEDAPKVVLADLRGGAMKKFFLDGEWLPHHTLY